MPVWAWVVGGGLLWAIVVIALIAGVKRDRQRASESLAELGLEVVETRVLDLNAAVAPRLIARGTVAGAEVRIEDLPVRRVEHGGSSPFTRVRTNLARSGVPDLLVSSHSFHGPAKTQATGMRGLEVPPPFDQVVAAHGPATPEAGRLVAALVSTDWFAQLISVRNVGSFCELSVFAGQLTVVLAGMALAKDKIAPVLGLIEWLVAAQNWNAGAL